MEQSLETKQKRRYLKKISIISTFGGLLFGYDSGVINGALTYMKRKDQLNLTPLTEGIVTSSLLIGAAFGSILGGHLSDKFGRRTIIRVLSIIFFFGALGCAFSPNASVMIACRFVLGLAVGGASVIVPTFLAEMAPTHLRGSIVAQDQLMIVTGQLLAYVFNAILGNLIGDPGVWRYMLTVASIPAVILWFGMLVVPETPRWLAANGKASKALEILRQVREQKEAEAEFREIQKTIEAEKQLDRATLRDLGIPWIRRLILIGCAVGITQQIAGINIMMYYGTTILEESGFGVKVALIANIANGAMSVFASWFYMKFMANRCGRKTLLIVGYTGTTLTMFVMFIITRMLAGTSILPYIVVALTMVYLAVFQSTLGPITWLVLSEIFPLRIRGIGFGIATFCSWMANFTVGLTFPILISRNGLSNTFLVFVATGIICVLNACIFVPETRGKSLEQLEEFFRNYKTEISNVDVSLK